jgi:hypothetical protein
MKKVLKKGLLASTLIGSTLFANNSVGSEASHFVGHFAFAGISTAIVDRYFPEYREDRAWIGFWTNTALAGILLGVDLAQNHDDVSGELLDFGVSVLGGALGAYATDRWILAPVVREAPDGSHTYGLQVKHKF